MLNQELIDSRERNDELSKEIARLWNELNTSEQSRLAGDATILEAHRRISELEATLVNKDKLVVETGSRNAVLEKESVNKKGSEEFESLNKELLDCRYSNDQLSQEISRLWEELNTS